MVEGEDHDRIIRLEANLSALDRLVAEQRKNLDEAVERSTQSFERRLDQVVDAQTKLAEKNETSSSTQRDVLAASLKAEVDKLQQQITTLSNQISDMKISIVPRGELKVLLDAVSSKQEGIAKSVFDVAQNIATLRSSLSGQKEAKNEATSQARWWKDHRTNIISVIVALLAVLVSIYYGLSSSSPPSHPSPPGITKTK